MSHGFLADPRLRGRPAPGTVLEAVHSLRAFQVIGVSVPNLTPPQGELEALADVSGHAQGLTLLQESGREDGVMIGIVVGRESSTTSIVEVGPERRPSVSGVEVKIANPAEAHTGESCKPVGKHSEAIGVIWCN